MRGVVRRHRLRLGDRFVVPSEFMTIIGGRLGRTESLTAPIIEVHDNGQRCVLADGTTIYGDNAAYIERDDSVVLPEDLARGGGEIEI